MELRQLEYFLKIIECKTLVKAAEELHVSQSGLTRSIQALEQELKVELFERKNKRLILNDYGKVVMQGAKNIVNEVNTVEIKVKNLYNLNTSLYIGSIAPAPLWGIRYLMQKYDSNSILRYDSILDSDTLIKGLNQNKYSAILLDQPIYKENLKCFKIFDETLYISVPLHHALCKKDGIIFKELEMYNFLEYGDTGYWHQICVQNLKRSHFIVQENLEDYKLLQKESSLITFRTNLTIPRFQLHERRKYIPILDACATLSFYLVCLKSEYKKIEKIHSHLDCVDWTQYRSEDFTIE